MIRKVWASTRRGTPAVTAAATASVATALIALLLSPAGTGSDGAGSVPEHLSASPGPTVMPIPTATRSAAVATGTPGTGSLVGPTSGPLQTGIPTPSAVGTRAPLVIGVAVPDLSVVRSLGPAYDLGPVEEQFKAAAAAYRRSHRLPVNGRDIRFVFRTFNVFDDADQRRVCTQLVDDDHAFAVMAYFLFLEGARCAAGDKHVPTINADPLSQSDLAAAAPYLYSVAPENGRVLRQQVDWMIASGLVKGHRVGLYYPSTPDTLAALIRSQFVARLKARGYELAADVATSDGTAGGPTDAVAVQRFESAHVDVAVLLTSPLSKANFLQSADTQGYHPTQVTSDVAIDTTTAAASSYSAKAFDGAWGLTSYRSGEIEVGTFAPRTRSCLGDYRAATGRSQPKPEAGELPSVLGVCDSMDVLLSALELAGPDVTQATLVAGLQHVSLVSMAGTSSASFGPGKYGGLDRARTVRWHKDCRCWKAVGAFTEMVP